MTAAQRGRGGRWVAIVRRLGRARPHRLFVFAAAAAAAAASLVCCSVVVPGGGGDGWARGPSNQRGVAGVFRA